VAAGEIGDAPLPERLRLADVERLAAAVLET
jgi:hypothetical protein